MRFQSVQVLNYKSFRDSGEIPLASGFNVIVGKNDAGKSTLVEALSLKAQNNPHRSLLTLPKIDSQVLSVESITRVGICLTPEEFKEILTPLRMFSFEYSASIDPPSAFTKFQDLLTQPVKFIIEWTNSNFRAGWLEFLFEDPSIYQHQSVTISNADYPDGFSPVLLSETHSGSSLCQIIAGILASRIYAFRAERLNVGECTANGNSILAPNASNLAEVLNHLSSANPWRFEEKFLGHVRTIFPHITLITAPVVPGTTTAKVLVWNIPGKSERADLAVPLSEGGTGVGQVLAILYVVVTADTPKIIIIDEPQSFLHPGAVRKLLEILRQYPQHQYVITTHATTAIAATGAESLIRVRRDEYESFADSISAHNESELRLFLADVGASLSDVFGADNVLWVEGKTEELCFPMIVRELNQTPLLGLQILAVLHTADLEGKLASRIFDVYNRLTSANTLLPPAIAFILDREGKTTEQMTEIDRKSKGQVRWLKRRMYENYLLHPLSIAQILNEDDTENQDEITVQDVESWLSNHAIDDKYFDQHAPTLTYPSSDWENTVHAAKLLTDLFGELTDCRVSYRKVEHGLRLTEFLITERTPAILELGAFLKSVLADEHPDVHTVS
jgi:ABC-type branched-subunit amino acid transport system ATPase component